MLKAWHIEDLTFFKDMAFGTTQYTASFIPQYQMTAEPTTIAWQFVWMKNDRDDWQIFREIDFPVDAE